MVKKLKDPNAPKKPATPFLQFRISNFKKIQKKMKVGYSFKELNQKISAEWSALSESVKKPMVDEYETKLKKFSKLNEAYKLTGNYKKFQLQKQEFKADQKVAKGKAKFKKDPNAPKKAATAYFCFLEDKRAGVKEANPTLINKDIIKKLGEMWTALTEADKKQYVDEAAKRKVKYEKDLEAYKRSAGYKKYSQEKADFLEERSTLLKAAKKAKSPKSKKAKSPKAKKKGPKSPAGAKKAKKPKAPKSKARKAPKKAKSAKKAPKKASKAKKGKKSTK